MASIATLAYTAYQIYTWFVAEQLLIDSLLKSVFGALLLISLLMGFLNRMSTGRSSVYSTCLIIINGLFLIYLIAIPTALPETWKWLTGGLILQSAHMIFNQISDKNRSGMMAKWTLLILVSGLFLQLLFGLSYPFLSDTLYYLGILLILLLILNLLKQGSKDKSTETV